MTERMHSLFTSVYLCLAIVIGTAQTDDPACEEPPDIRFASVTDTSDHTYRIGTTIIYGCQYGYVVSGKSRTLSCILSRNNAEWTEPQFSCVPQSCGDPGIIANGQRIGSLFTFPNSVTYYCDTGYTLHGISSRYCQTSGTWSGRLPVCEVITCDQPKEPENGHVTVSSLEYGSELIYKCDIGFTLSIDEAVYCTEEGSWSQTDVTCIEIACEIPERPEYGYVNFHGSEDRPRAGSIAIFSCEGDRIPYGPTTSKCLEIGEWTFPPPKCLEPCSVQYIPNGEIVKYVRQGYRRKVYKTIKLGTRVEDDEDLHLLCSNGFDASGSEKQEAKISCKKGKWSVVPHCEPASCRSSAPSGTNAFIVDINPVHGGTVSYRCFTDYKKSTDETVICNHGVWNGSPPTCKSTKCSVDKLTYQGLLKGYQSSYRDGEAFKIICDSRYRLADGNRDQIRCEEGTWNLPSGFSPCIPANCSQLPPKIEHGNVKNLSMIHGSVVKYDCGYPYIPVGGTIVQCAFGNWEGQPPNCKDSRCYLHDLKTHVSSAAHVSSASQSATFSGNTLNIVCDEGYSATSELPMCQNGVWSWNYGTLCKESGCTIPKVNDGSVTEEKLGDWRWVWLKFRYERDVDYNPVRIGSIVSSGTVLWLFCNEQYYFQGNDRRREPIQCLKGRWSTDLVCLRYGQRYVPSTTATSLRRSTLALDHFPGGLTTTTNSIFPPVTPSTRWTSPIDVDKIDGGDTVKFLTEPPVEECFCEYPIDDSSIVAHADGKRLNYGDKVRDGTQVVFRCLHVGYHRFSGRREITCDNCQAWHSRDFPSCTVPSSGNTVILFDKNINVLMKGDIEMHKGQSTNFTCIAMETAKYPKWIVPTTTGISYKNERVEREEYGDVLYLTHMYLQNADYNNEGIYECYIEDNSATLIDLIVVDPDLRCPEFPEDDGIIVNYEMERRERTNVSFSCPKKGQELIGKPVLTCLRNGEWSDLPPYCTEVKCKELQENDLLQIHYRNDRNVGSTATFHCFVPGKRSGVSYTKCLENGSWADPTPTCDTVPCKVDDLLSAVPANVAVTLDKKHNISLLYNSTVKIRCTGDMITVGKPVAKCEKEGTWKIDVVKCDSGCRPPAKSLGSQLKLSPEKEIYKFGERLTFSCPPGMTLNTDSQVIMCLITGWSETFLPQCNENESYDDYSDFKESTTEADMYFDS